MSEYRGFDILDFFVLIVKWKKLLLTIAILSLGLSYVTIYFLIPPQYESKALIVSTGEDKLNAVGALTKSLTNLPLASLGFGGLSSTENYDLFTTIIYSRSNLEKMINTFDLMEDYKIDKWELAFKALTKSITTNVTEEMAFEISVWGSSPQKAADMTNYILKEVNEAVIELNVRKSRQKRVFLEKRYEDVKIKLSMAEDSLQHFQLKENFLDAEEQLKANIDAYTILEADLIKKEVEKSVLENLVKTNSGEYQLVSNQVDELNKKLDNLKKYGKENSILIPFASLPVKAMDYIRLRRNVEIFNAMLEFIIPLFEQSKFDEINDVPVLQVIDYGKPAERKGYPPRTLFAFIITFVILVIVLFILMVMEIISKSNNDKIIFLKKEIFNFSRVKK